MTASCTEIFNHSSRHSFTKMAVNPNCITRIIARSSPCQRGKPGRTDVKCFVEPRTPSDNRSDSERGSFRGLACADCTVHCLSQLTACQRETAKNKKGVREREQERGGREGRKRGEGGREGGREGGGPSARPSRCQTPRDAHVSPQFISTHWPKGIGLNRHGCVCLAPIEHLGPSPFFLKQGLEVV